MQIKTAMSCNGTFVRMLRVKETEDPDPVTAWSKREVSRAAGRSADSYGPSEDSLAVSCRVKCMSTLWPSNFTFMYLPKRNENIRPQNNLCSDFQSSVPGSQERGTTWRGSWRMDPAVRPRSGPATHEQKPPAPAAAPGQAGKSRCTPRGPIYTEFGNR